MLALNSPIFSVMQCRSTSQTKGVGLHQRLMFVLLQAKPTFDLVVSGINRGDNAGLHVIYSGTVGAAREAACKVGLTRAL